jgi:hypothetical protein
MRHEEPVKILICAVSGQDPLGSQAASLVVDDRPLPVLQPFDPSHDPLFLLVPLLQRRIAHCLSLAKAPRDWRARLVGRDPVRRLGVPVHGPQEVGQPDLRRFLPLFDAQKAPLDGASHEFALLCSSADKRCSMSTVWIALRLASSTPATAAASSGASSPVLMAATVAAKAGRRSSAFSIGGRAKATRRD